MTMVAWGGIRAAKRPGLAGKYLSPPPAKIRSDFCKCNSLPDTGGAVREQWVVVVHTPSPRSVRAR